MSELWECVAVSPKWDVGAAAEEVARANTIRDAVADACVKSLAIAAQAHAYNDAIASARVFSQPDPIDGAWFRAIDAADDAWALVAILLDEGTDDA